MAAAGADKLKGLIHFIGQYVMNARMEASGYEKKRFPVLARTSFAGMYRALGDQAKGAFRVAADTMVKD